VELNELLRQAVNARSVLSPAPRFEAGVGPASVLAHPARLDRVIGHLIQNAVEATAPEGQVTVTLSREDGCAVITICDTGCGMSEQFIRHRLFRPFESSKAAGMGIGTYEAEQYVRERGGRIAVESTEGKGSVFRVTLPLHVSENANEAGIAAESHA
jgi:signal transduction histidine kinase